MSDSDKLALRLGKILMGSLFIEPDLKDGDMLNKFFLDKFLSVYGSSTGATDSFNIDLICKVQNAMMQAHMEWPDSVHGSISSKESEQDSRFAALAQYPSEYQQDDTRQPKAIAAIALEALDVIIKEYGRVNPLFQIIKGAIQPLIFSAPVGESENPSTEHDTLPDVVFCYKGSPLHKLNPQVFYMAFTGLSNQLRNTTRLNEYLVGIPINCVVRHHLYATNGVAFTLVVDDFGVKFQDPAGADDLIRCLQLYYTLTIKRNATKYLGLTIAIDKVAREVRMSAPGVIAKALQRFAPHSTAVARSLAVYQPPRFGAAAHTPDSPDTSPPLTVATCNNSVAFSSITVLQSIQRAYLPSLPSNPPLPTLLNLLSVPPIVFSPISAIILTIY